MRHKDPELMKRKIANTMNIVRSTAYNYSMR